MGYASVVIGSVRTLTTRPPTTNPSRSSSAARRTARSFALAIVGAEYILRWLPPGTHRWDKFITPEELEAALAAGQCDAVSAGRAFIADPYLYRHLRDNTPGPRCIDCNACVGHLGSQPADCYHPAIRAEKDAMLARMDAPADASA